MEVSSDDRSPDRAVATAYSVLSEHPINESKDELPAHVVSRPSIPSAGRLSSSHSERPFRLSEFIQQAPSKSKDETVFYLAYGSNLAARKFLGDRGIKPLSQINVQVPSLRLTFDLPGIPYKEPCFANSARRDPDNEIAEKQASAGGDEKTMLLQGTQSRRDKYRKNKWHKAMIGVVYEVTLQDYAHIIATEGGGSGYQDIIVDCHPFASSNPNDPVPQTPTLPPFKAHTLFAPAVPVGGEPPKDGGHIQRPDPDYAQASARYLKLLTDGAAECELPYEYQDYLLSLRPYRITTTRQRIAQGIFLAAWMPIVGALFALAKMTAGKDGRLPKWMRVLFASLFNAVWTSYDYFFKPIFGDGERTIGDDEAEDGMPARMATRKA